MIAAFCTLGTLAAALPFFALFQLSGYRAVRDRKARKFALSAELSALAAAAVGALAALFAGDLTYFALAPFFAVFAVALTVRALKRFAKTPPRVTARFVRLCASGLFVCAAAGVAAEFAARGVGMRWSGLFAAATYALAPASAYVALALSLPGERAIAAKYKRRCRRALAAKPELLTIAITGSFGKTGVKTYLAAMLSSRYRVFASPKSYNTPAGICLSVAAMPKDAQIFIAEVGARKRGDVAEICKMIEPVYGLVTGVAEQHLETFGSFENVFAAKRELPDHLAAHGGTCCFNTRNGGAARMYRECGCRALSSGDCGDCAIEGVALSAEGSAFTLVFCDGERAECKTRLLGLANIENVALAACAAHDLGVSANEIAAAVAALEPAPHRMQLIRSGALTIIDDSYNANPAGVKNAFDALGLFEGKRAVATQGIVEGGKEGARLNFELGRELAAVADVAIAIGPNAADIESGLASAGYLGKLYVARDLEDAKRLFATVLDGVSVLLIQNDLPDNY